MYMSTYREQGTAELENRLDCLRGWSTFAVGARDYPMWAAVVRLTQRIEAVLTERE